MTPTELLGAVRMFLEAIAPGLYVVTLATSIWALMAGVRRWAPWSWEYMANLWWFRKLELEEQLSGFDRAMRKAWQAIPSIASGAVVLAVLSGGNWRDALVGAVVGAVAPVIHETRKAWLQRGQRE